MGAMCAKEVFELLDATREDDLERIKELLANGVDINQKDDAQWTALHVICTSHAHKLKNDGEGALVEIKLEILDTLLGAGADLKATSRSGATPLMEAAFNDFEEAAKRLIDGGSDLDQQNAGGRTAMHLASEQGNAAILRMLLEAGANPLKKDKQGETPFTMGADSSKKILDEFGYGGDMTTTVEQADIEMMKELERTGQVRESALEEMEALSTGRRAAMSQDEVEKSGVITVGLTRAGDDLTATIFEGKRLKDMDLVGSNDVYVTVRINDEQQQRTKTLPNAGGVPVWNQGRGQKLTFKNVGKLSSVVFTAYDEDFGGDATDDTIGLNSLPGHKLEDLNGKGSSWTWEADLVLRVPDAEQDTGPGETSAQYLVNGVDPNATVSNLNPLSK